MNPLGDRLRHARARRQTWPRREMFDPNAPGGIVDDLQCTEYVCPDIERARAIADRFVLPKDEPVAVFGRQMPHPMMGDRIV